MTENRQILYLTTLNPTERRALQSSYQNWEIVFILNAVELLFLENADDFPEWWIDEDHEEAQTYLQMQQRGDEKIKIINKVSIQ